MQPSEEVKQKINIVDLVGEYVKLRKAGANFRALCPFHQEKTPSFMVSASKQIWHCFGCGNGGDVFEFVKQIEGVEFREALEMLASRAGVVLRRPTVEYRAEQDQKKTLYAINDLAAKYYAKVFEASPVAEAARQYIQKRGFKPETVRQWQLGFAPDDFHAFENFVITRGFQKQEAAAAGLLIKKDDGSFYDRFRGRIMFPIFDIHGRVVGFTGRILEPINRQATGQEPAKYVNSPETPIYSKSRVLYGLNFAKSEIRKENSVIVVEGNVDVITCLEFGFANVVGSSGTALGEAQLLLLQRFTNNIYFAFDVDEAGLTAARRAVELALSGGFNVRLINIPRQLAKDPDELIRRDPALWQHQVTGAQNFLDFYFSQIFAKLDLTSSIGKKQAVSGLLPLVALLPDPIDRQDYLRKLSGTTGVDEKILFEKLNSLGRPAPEAAAPTAAQPKPGLKTRQEMLQERLLGMVFKFPQENWREVLQPEDFSTPALRDIFLQGNSPQHQKQIELLVFAVENELEILGQYDVKAIKAEFVNMLKGENLRQRMKTLELRIRQAESTGKPEEVEALSGEFNTLTRELNTIIHG